MQLLSAVLGLALINVITIWRFYTDKQRAVAGMQRVPEADLLGLALIGGTPGAFFARHRFRHKIRKQPFSTALMLIAAIQAGVAISFLF